MSYQALLFCPEEKTARTVTQVLSELDFTVVPCTEPFAAVKRLMGERFDAVVVDCDNEQNATLLFKSARNAPNNSSALAVAVVEGQAGVAKAFRIGANLVLTKPINVEQAKGTLRVARGLLRKNEGAKPTSSPVATPTKTSAPVPAKPASSVANVTDIRPAAPLPAKTGESILPTPPPIQNPMPHPTAVAHSSREIDGATTPRETGVQDTDKFSSMTPAQPGAIAAQPAKIIASSSNVAQRPGGAGSAASAAAPAREVKSGPQVEEKAPATSTEATEVPTTVAIEESSAPSAGSTAVPAPTFGGAAEIKPASGGSKTMLIAAAAVVVIAAASYGAWTKFAPSKSVSTASVQTTAPAPAPSAVPHPAAPSGAVMTPPSVGPGMPDATVSETVLPASSTKAPHSSKSTTAPESSQPANAVENVDKKSAPVAPPRPIVIKSDSGKTAGKTGDVADAPGLSLTAISASNAALPDLMGSSKTPTPVLQRLMVSQGVSRGLLVKEVQPSYPHTALQMHVEGSVQLIATVTKNGDISDVKVLSGNKELGRAATEAVKQWKYKPYLLNGEPVDIQTQITVNFKLPR